ncbi:MAG: hypothetical protein GY719_26200 [bacterium]|nr:hypothetical protein [bacterium]
MSDLSKTIRELGWKPGPRFSAPRETPGVLKAQWGKLRGYDPDIVFAGGAGTSRADRSLLHGALCCERAYPNHKYPFGIGWDPALLQELAERGYDLRTLKFSIRKLVVRGG